MRPMLVRGLVLTALAVSAAGCLDTSGLSGGGGDGGDAVNDLAAGAEDIGGGNSDGTATTDDLSTTLADLSAQDLAGGGSVDATGTSVDLAAGSDGLVVTTKDLSVVTPLPDLVVPVDSAAPADLVPCGEIGQACCAAGACKMSCCDASNVCVTYGSSCGGTPARVCLNTNQCAECGFPSQPCCAASACVGGGCCNANVGTATCVASGASINNLSSVCLAGQLVHCGLVAEPCCEQNRCRADGTMDTGCCAYNLCSSTASSCSGIGGICGTTGSCGPPQGRCGGIGSNCCNGNPTGGLVADYCTGAGLRCSAMSQCGACGAPGEACCDGSTCDNGGCCLHENGEAVGRCVASGASCGMSLGSCSAGGCLGGMCGQANQQACTGVGCTAPLTVSNMSGSCLRCGNLGQPCCLGQSAADRYCSQPFACDSGGSCVACGQTGMPCCRGGVCKTGTCNGSALCM